MSTVRRRGRMGFMLRITLALIGVYIVYCGVLFLAQNVLIFPGWKLVKQVARESAPRDVEQVWITTSDGDRVEAWFIRAPRLTAGERAPAVMHWHGNGELIDQHLGLARLYGGMGVSTLLVEYRGYGRSGGEPSQATVMADAEAFREWLAQRPDVDQERVVYHGRSLGGGAAVALAERRPARALIVESTFTSVAAMARGFGAPGFLVRSPFRNDRSMPRLRMPILILHGTQDLLIPPEHGRRLHALAPTSRYIELEGGHNDFPWDFSAYAHAIREFLVEAGVVVKPVEPLGS